MLGGEIMAEDKPLKEIKEDTIKKLEQLEKASTIEELKPLIKNLIETRELVWKGMFDISFKQEDLRILLSNVADHVGYEPKG